MMKKAILAIVLVGLVAMPMMSAMAGKGGKAGKSDIVHLDLAVQVDSINGDDAAAVAALYADAFGRIKYNLDGNLEFVFNGHNLIAGETYVLRSGGNDLGEPAVANGGGNVHIQASLDITAADLGGSINLWVISDDDESRIMRAEAIK